MQNITDRIYRKLKNIGAFREENYLARLKKDFIMYYLNFEHMTMLKN